MFRLYILVIVLVLSDTPPAFRGFWVPRIHQEQGDNEDLRRILNVADERHTTDLFLQLDLYDTFSKDLKDVIDAANDRNVAVHAWVNLFRVRKLSDVRTLRHPCRLLGNECYQDSDHAWMNPTSPDVQEYVSNTVLTMIQR